MREKPAQGGFGDRDETIHGDAKRMKLAEGSPTTPGLRAKSKYSMRRELAAAGSSSMARRADLVERLPDWCRRAGARAIEELHKLPRKLRSYATLPDSGFQPTHSSGAEASRQSSHSALNEVVMSIVSRAAMLFAACGAAALALQLLRKTRNDASMNKAALNEWENEGGSLASSPAPSDANVTTSSI